MGSKSDLRHRKKGKAAEHPVESEKKPGDSGEGGVTVGDFVSLAWLIWLLIGVALLFVISYWFAGYVQSLHENQMWFTHIQEVEREISLRTECGLYYSYYKQLVNAESFWDGLVDLTRDNSTEHGHTINILERMNVYQEVFLAWIYRTFRLHFSSTPAILFYVYSIFKLTGVYLGIVYVTAWYLAKSWMAGVLAALLFIVNLTDTTRVTFSINLRESFALPMLFAQSFFICVYLERKETKAGSVASSSIADRLCLFLIFLFTWLFSVTWQFNQFILLLQGFALYGLFVLHLAPRTKLCNILITSALGLLGVMVLQFGQSMIVGSLFIAFVPSAVLMMWLQKDFTLTGGILDGSLKIVFQVITVLMCTFATNWLIKWAIRLEADQHIFKFIKGKFGFGNPTDFESRIYLCHGAFVFLDNNFFVRTTYGYAFPLYFTLLIISLFVIGKNLLLEWCAPILPSEWHRKLRNVNDPSDKPQFFNRRCNLTFFLFQSVFAGLVALTTLRIKYFWSPHICVLGAVMVCDFEIWRNLFGMLSVKRRAVIEVTRHVVTGFFIAIMVLMLKPRVEAEMQDLQEFYDPDTVELMYWIGNNTEPTDSFGGSMQLLAGVKACTGRHLTNHPHYEDKWLRERTKQVYQIYGRRKPEEVYEILRRIDAKYIILEDSICLATPSADLCRTPDLVDLDNGHIPDIGFSIPGLRRTDTPRFCHEIRNNDPSYTRFFKLVLENRTFRVYKVLQGAKYGLV